jgi:DNA primase
MLMSDSEPLSERIKRSVDIVELAKSMGVDSAGYGKNISCPFHGDKSPSFRFYPDDTGGHYRCFSGCEASGDSGDVFSFVERFLSTDFRGALSYLADYTGVSLRRSEESPLEKALGLAGFFYRKDVPESVIDYFLGRGFTKETLDHFEIGYAPSGNRLSRYGKSMLPELQELGLVQLVDGKMRDLLVNRTTFPIKNAKGCLCGFAGRVLDDRKPKYINSPASSMFKKSELLFGLHLIPHGTARLYVVEGYTDVMAFYQAGEVAVCAMGVAVSTTALSGLIGRCDEIVFLFDGDAAGRNGAWAAAKAAVPLAASGECVFRFAFLGSNDPCELLIGADAKPEVISQAVNDSLLLSEFVLSELSRSVQVKRETPEFAASMSKSLNKFIAAIPAGPFLDSLTQSMSSICGIPAVPVSTIEFSTKHPELIDEIEALLNRHGFLLSDIASEANRLRFIEPNMD